MTRVMFNFQYHKVIIKLELTIFEMNLLSTFLDNLRLFIDSFSQLLELLFLCDVTDTISRKKLGSASLLHALPVLRKPKEGRIEF